MVSEVNLLSIYLLISRTRQEYVAMPTQTPPASWRWGYLSFLPFFPSPKHDYAKCSTLYPLFLLSYYDHYDDTTMANHSRVPMAFCN